jgi:hypothetical protein
MRLLRTIATMSCCSVLFVSAASAEGALVIAAPANIAEDGYSSGISYNYRTEAEAEARALRECRNSKDAPPSTRKLCQLVRRFVDQCAVVALDPQEGTPGAGWAVAPTLALARNEALRACNATAGSNRQGRCEISVEGCDGRAR